MEELDYRYVLASLHSDIESEDVIIDLCSGNSRFEDCLSDNTYYLSCDLYDERASFNMSDKEFVEEVITQCDVLSLFGYGGFEVDGNPLESSTVLPSIKYVIDNFEPRTVILESIQKYVKPLRDIMNGYPNYEISFEYGTNGDIWLTKRYIMIFKRKEL